MIINVINYDGINNASSKRVYTYNYKRTFKNWFEEKKVNLVFRVKTVFFFFFLPQLWFMIYLKVVFFS